MNWWDSYLTPIEQQQYMVRNQMRSCFRSIPINPEVAQAMGANYGTFDDMMDQTLGYTFIDLGVMIRLGSALESGLGDYYTQRTGTKINPSDPRRGLFQRFNDTMGQDSVETEYQHSLQYDLRSNSHYGKVREIMVHRISTHIGMALSTTGKSISGIP